MKNIKLSKKQTTIVAISVVVVVVLTVVGVSFSGNLFQGSLSLNRLSVPSNPQQAWQVSCDQVQEAFIRGNMTDFVNGKLGNTKDQAVRQATWTQVQKCMDQFTKQCLDMSCMIGQKGAGAFSTWLQGQSALTQLKAKYCAKVNWYGVWGTCPKWVSPQRPL